MLLDVYGCFDKWLRKAKDKIDIKKDYGLSLNASELVEVLTHFYNNVLLCYYTKNDTFYYINKTVDNYKDFLKIKNEKQFLKFLHKLDSD